MFELCLSANIMGQDQTAPLWSFGSSLIRINSVSFHMIKSEVHLDILYAADVNSRQHFQDQILTGSGLTNYELVELNI